MTFSKQELRNLYRKRAIRYDFIATWIYPLAGFQVSTFRRDSVQALSLYPGATVVDMGCGTGLNFRYLEQAVGTDGKIIGVDLTDAMLEQAQKRTLHAGWKNVELVQADLATYEFPSSVSGLLSTVTMMLVPEYDDVIRRGAEALISGGRMAILDYMRPDHWPDWTVRFAAWLNNPFGVTIGLADRHPQESVRRYLTEVL